MKTCRHISMSVVEAEFKNCVQNGAFVGMATIAVESLKRVRDRKFMIRTAASLAISTGSRLQAEHLVVVRYAVYMTPDIRRRFNMMPTS